MKRFVSLVLVFVMVFVLTIPSVWATETTVAESSASTTNGTYDEDGTWTPVDGDGTMTVTDDRGLEVRLKKTAAPVAEDGNAFDVTLQVETTVTTKAAATVLVIDVSGSMNRCAECGVDLGDYHSPGCEHSGSGFFPDRVQDSQTRMAAARTAAIRFLERYKGDRETMGRYVAVVAFATKGHVMRSWVDVSSPEGYAQAVAAVNELSAGGGTNLDDGLYQADELLQDAAVASVEREQKNVIALTDGVPTYHRHGGEGSKGSRSTNRATAATAKGLREDATVYTICFGASDERCYSNGPAVGDFLEQEIATPSGGEKQYAYSAKDTAELQQAFAEITQCVVSGANGAAWVVDDPMGDYVTVERAPDNGSVSEDRKELTWHLSDPTVTTEGGKTVYVYELTYRIRVDSNAEGFDETKFHPANGRTYLRGPTENRVAFPVPGVKCALPYFTVTYQQGEHGSLQGQDAQGQVVHAPVKKGAPTPEAPNVTAEEGYYFTGWQPEVSPTVQDNVTYVAQYAPQKEIVVRANSASLLYNGEEQSVSGLEKTEFSIDGKTYTVEGLSAAAAGTTVGLYPVSITGTPVVMCDGRDVTHQFRVETEDGTLAIQKLPVTVTIHGNTDVREFTGKAQTVKGYTVAVENPLYAEKNIRFDGAAAARGTEVGTYAMGLRQEQFRNTDDNFAVTFLVNDGSLQITPVDAVVVTITGHKDTRLYDGAPKAVTGYDVSTSHKLYTEKDFAFAGTARSEGTDAGTYPMGLRAEDFKNTNPNFENVVFQVSDGALEITPRKAELVSASGRKAYDGTPLVKEQVTVRGDGFVRGEGADYHDFAALTVVGKVQNDFQYTLRENTKAANYAISVVPGTLEITPHEATIIITANSGTKVYDGTALTDDGYTVDGALMDGDELTAVVKGHATNVADKGVNQVVSYRILRGDVDVTANYAGVTTVDGKLEITKRDVLLTSASDSKPYDGTPLTAEAVTVSGSGFAEGEGARYSHFASRTKVGRQENTFEYTLAENTLAENYHITVVNGWLSVTRHTQAKLTAEGYTGIYDGAAHDGVISCQVTGGVDTDSWKYIYSLDSQTFVEMMPQFRDVGVYTVYVKAFNDNYGGDALVTAVTVEITPAQITLTADNQTRGTGETDPALTYQVQTPVADEMPVFDGALVREPGESRGTYPIAQGSLRLRDGDGFRAANYTLHYVPGELTILQRALAVTKTVDRTKIQTGDEVTYTITVTNTGDVDLEKVVLQDEMLGVQEELGRLACGDCVTRTYTYSAVGGDAGKRLINTVVVTAEGGVREETDSEATDVQPKSPDTGDERGMSRWLMGMMVSAAGVMALVCRRKRRMKGA